MKIRKKTLIFSLISIILASTCLVGGVVYWKINGQNHTEIMGDEPETNPNPNGNSHLPKPSNSEEENPFFAKDLIIAFSGHEKAQIVEYNAISAYIKIDYFKYYFIVELNKLGPNSDEINLKFLFDSDQPKKVAVKYLYGKDLLKSIIWYFELKKV